MTSLARLTHLTKQAWKYGLLILEDPQQAAQVSLLQLKGVHAGEFLKMNLPWIKNAGIGTMIDIGAHSGEFSSAIRAILPDVQIYAFEPQADCYAKLKHKLEPPGSFQAFQVALGDETGEANFWRSSFSKSSSVLPMAELHQNAFPWSAETICIPVQMRTLDSYLDTIELRSKVFVKIDVQGFEDRVLQGSRRTLAQTDFVLTEVSFQPLYRGQSSFSEVYELLTGLGFSYRGNLEQLLSPRDKSILQADAFFVRD